VTTPPTIPLLRVSGTHRDVGAQLGEACADTIRSEAAFQGQKIPEGRTRKEQLALADRYREVTSAAYPWYVEELAGAAEAADVDPLALFACMIEEIWYEPHGRKLQGRCTDLVAVPPATAGGHVLVAHNNDMPRTYQDRLVAAEWRVEGDPAILTIGNGIWMSAGWNSAGLSFTGNELAPLDEKIGIPREVQFRSMLRQPTMEMAVGEALRHDRASSYNNVLVSRDGEVVNVEGSATDAELTDADDHGHLVHTNHYVCERMLRYEGDPDYVPHSGARYRRAQELLAAAEPGTIDVDMLRAFLSDHEGKPDCLCRHPELWGGPNDSATAFWCIADVSEMRVLFGRGNPCDSVAQEFVFSD
jgi:isopenicillin-N N-acyltransferase-like protein